MSELTNWGTLVGKTGNIEYRRDANGIIGLFFNETDDLGPSESRKTTLVAKISGSPSIPTPKGDIRFTMTAYRK